MEAKQIQSIKSIINEKIQTGDYTTLSKVLDVGYSTAFSKFSRCDKKAVLVMQSIIKNREKLIKKLKTEYK